MNTPKLYKKLHRWPGLIIAFALLYFGATGIVMNHRDWLARYDVGRNYLPPDYTYRQWNNAAIKGSVQLGDSTLVYGNIGIWLADSTLSNYTDFNIGFPKGIDNRKIFDVHQSADGHLYAATLFGLYAYNGHKKEWEPFGLKVDNQRFVGIESVGDTLFVVNRSYLFKGISRGIHTQFEQIEIPPPPGYKKQATLFETIWQFHSGEIFGLPGKLFVDLMGIATVFLSLTGIVFFFFPPRIKQRSRQGKKSQQLVSVSRWSLKWHNHVGAWLVAFLVILYFTGVFLRPPLLIPIAGVNVKPIKYSHLDQPNPWHDKLRDLVYDSARQRLMLATSEGIYFMPNSHAVPQPVPYQPPVSVMGINVFEPYDDGAFIVGSFSGIFLWHPNYPEILDFYTGKPYVEVKGGRPVGDVKITGLVTDHQQRMYAIDYANGAIPLWHNAQMPDMPENVRKASRISLWNLALEIHTGRFFSFIFGMFYILIVPLAGLASVMVVLSGYLLWRKKYKRTKLENHTHA